MKNIGSIKVYCFYVDMYYVMTRIHVLHILKDAMPCSFIRSEKNMPCFLFFVKNTPCSLLSINCAVKKWDTCWKSWNPTWKMCVEKNSYFQRHQILCEDAILFLDVEIYLFYAYNKIVCACLWVCALARKQYHVELPNFIWRF